MFQRMKIYLLLGLVLFLLFIQQQPTGVMASPDTVEGQKEDDNDEDEGETVPFVLDIDEPKGNNGYYLEIPEAVLKYSGDKGSLDYVVRCNGKEKTNGELTADEEEVVFAEDVFEEGKNEICIMPKDQEGKDLPDKTFNKEILIDSKSPAIEPSMPMGFDCWYSGEGEMTVDAYEALEGSGVKEIRLYCTGADLPQKASGNHAIFPLRIVSSGGDGTQIIISSEDMAGNVSSVVKTVYIDNDCPSIELSGVRDCQILNENIHLGLELRDNNILGENTFFAERSDEKGTRERLEPTILTNTGGLLESELVCREDGVYNIHVKTSDLAGHVAEQSIQFIIDKTKPVISYVHLLDKSIMNSFSLNENIKDWIRDLTSFDLEVLWDNKICVPGEVMTEEGEHQLLVRATDAAGNQAQAAAVITIDRTPPIIQYYNLRDGEKCEEKKNFGISLADPGDQISEIRINGSSKQLLIGENTYEYCVEGEGEYEVFVSARDKAGNKAVSRTVFQIVPARPLSKIITAPARVFAKKIAENGVVKKGIETILSNPDHPSSMPARAMAKIVGITILICLIGGTGLLMAAMANQRKKEKSPRKGRMPDDRD